MISMRNFLRRIRALRARAKRSRTRRLLVEPLESRQLLASAPLAWSASDGESLLTTSGKGRFRRPLRMPARDCPTSPSARTMQSCDG